MTDYISRFAADTAATRDAINHYVSTGVSAVAYVATLAAQIAMTNRADHLGPDKVALLSQTQVCAIITGTPDGRFEEKIAKDRQRNECLLAGVRLAMRYTSPAHTIDAPMNWLTGATFADCVKALHTQLAVSYPSVRAVQNLVSNASHTPTARDDVKRLTTALAHALKEGTIAPHNIATLADSLASVMDFETLAQFTAALDTKRQALAKARATATVAEAVKKAA